MAILEFFLSAATAFGKLLGWLASEDRKDRERIAIYFDQIASCMREVAERIEAGDPPRDTCRRLAVYADELQQILDDRHSNIASGDASIEATRRRLVAEMRQTYANWGVTSSSRLVLRGDEVVVNVKAVAKADSRSTSSVIGVDHLAGELEQELTGQMNARESVQKIWDASGEFKALADALRAR